MTNDYLGTMRPPRLSVWSGTMALGILPAAFLCAQGPPDMAYWDGIRARADSVLVHHFGSDFSHRHIFDPEGSPGYIALEERTVPWEDRHTVTTAPVYCCFEYDIGLDSTHASSNNIRLAITPDGHRVPTSIEPEAEWNGLIGRSASCAFAHDLDGFIALARSNGVKCRGKDVLHDLRWIPPDSAARAAGAFEGRYELTLGRYRRTGIERNGRTTYYYRDLRAIVFDPFTGAVVRKKNMQGTYRIACGW